MFGASRLRLGGGLAIIALLLTVCWTMASRGTPHNPDQTRSSERSHDLEISRAAGALRGRVSSQAGAAIADATVCVICFDCDRQRRDIPQTCTQSDAGGNYSLVVDSQTPLSVTAAASGFAPLSLPAPVSLEAAAEHAPVDLILTAGGAELRGSVVDVLGASVANAEVRVMWGLGRARQAISLHADEHGAFRAWLLPGPVSLLATAGDYAPARLEAIAPARSLTLALTPGGSLRGRVIDAHDSAPMAAVVVRARALDRQTTREDTYTTSDRDGYFELKGLFPGHFNLVAKAKGFRMERVVSGEVKLGEHAHGAVVPLMAASSVEGSLVIEETQAPCTSGNLVLLPASSEEPADAPKRGALSNNGGYLAKIGRDGRGLFEGVAPGRYRVEVSCDAHRKSAGPDMIEVASEPIVDLRWTFAKGLSIRVRAESEAGATLPEVWLSLRQLAADGGGPPLELAGITSLSGDYEFSGLTPGRYTVRASGLPRTESVEVELHASDPVQTLTFKAISTAEMLVHVHTPSGEPAGDVTMYAMNSAVAEGRTQPRRVPITPVPRGEGNFQFRNLLPGEYEIFVSDRKNPEQRIPLEPSTLIQLAKDERRSFDVSYGGFTESLTGRVVDKQGLPIENVWVSAVHGGSSVDRLEPQLRFLHGEKRVLTTRDGAFRLSGLASDASYTVRAESAMGDAVGTVASVEPGRSIEVPLSAPRGVD